MTKQVFATQLEALEAKGINIHPRVVNGRFEVQVKTPEHPDGFVMNTFWSLAYTCSEVRNKAAEIIATEQGIEEITAYCWPQ